MQNFKLNAILSTDHLVTNEDEALRLSQLGLNVAQVSRVTEITRCLGFHQGKGGYKEIDFLNEAQDEPILWRPEIHGPFQIESQHLFMIIFTQPLIKPKFTSFQSLGPLILLFRFDYILVIEICRFK